MYGQDAMGEGEDIGLDWVFTHVTGIVLLDGPTSSTVPLEVTR